MCIPEVELPGIYSPHAFVDSPLVSIVDDDSFEVSMEYVKQGKKNATHSCLVRQEVYRRLQWAASMLPQGYRLKIFDAWRPFALQKELYDEYESRIIERFSLEGASEEEQKTFIRRFVSEPILDRKNSPVHTTGGAVDLTIIDSSGDELDMGTPFDHFDVQSYTAYYEKSDNTTVKENRRLLYRVMVQAGFVNLPSEWWHFDYGDRFWSFYTKKPALYAGIFSEEEMR